MSEALNFRWPQKLKILFMQYFGYLLLWVCGGTLRYEVQGWEHWKSLKRSRQPMIMAFWHGRIIPATWYFRKNRIVVMTSMNFDGEYIARFIRMHGYQAARGSSSRGGLRALAEMERAIKKGSDAGFTVDGPRGPRYQAKLGPVLLARRTGAPILCFHVSCRNHLRLNSWDHFLIPRPFSQALLLIAPPLYVSREAGEEEQREKHRQMQEILDDLRRKGDSHWGDPIRD